MADKKPDRRQTLNGLGKLFGKAMVTELRAHRKHMDALMPTQGVRTPTAEEMAIVKATKQGWLAASRERIMILNQMEDLLGIVHKPGKSIRELMDDIPDEPT